MHRAHATDHHHQQQLVDCTTPSDRAMNASLCAYSAPAAPVSAAEIAKDNVL
jgi:hypothetical protein